MLLISYYGCGEGCAMYYSATGGHRPCWIFEQLTPLQAGEKLRRILWFSCDKSERLLSQPAEYQSLW
jgi:hypothetical protein